MKKNLFTIAVTILAICASISSCKETTEPVLPSIELEKSTITFSETSQEAQQIKFTTTYAWELTYTAEWFTVTPTAGEKGESTITITLNSSDFSQELSDEITITSEEISKSITVTLSKTPETLEVDKTSISFSQENQDVQEAVVTSTYPWELTTDAEWFTVTPTQGDKGETTISVSLNTESFDEELSGTITITSGELTKTINVFLSETAYAEAFEIRPSRKNIVIGETMDIEVITIPEGAPLRGEITWSTSDSNIATAQEGTVTGIAEGTVTLTASADGVENATFEMNVTPIFVSDNTESTVSLLYISQFEGTGVVYDNENLYVNKNIRISETDTFTIGAECNVIMASDVEISIEGTCDISHPYKIMKESTEAEDASFYFTGDVNAGGMIESVIFEGVYFRYYGTDNLVIRDCDFQGITSRNSAINLGGDGTVTVSDCNFLENSYPAISGAANIPTGLYFQNNYLYKNCWDASNKPQINVTVGGNLPVEITGNTVIGPAEITKNGGIGVSNMVNLEGTNIVIISDNDVSDNRYGITLYGGMNATITGNHLLNNSYEENAMNGGSGLSFYYMGMEQNIYMSDNHIEGHLWGITNISMVAGDGPNLNLGNIEEGDNYNPGNNVFINNGNGGVLYDLYNNSSKTVYAQGNIWNVEVQDQESIEEVIFHKNDNDTLGEVIFMPAGE